MDVAIQKEESKENIILRLLSYPRAIIALPITILAFLVYCIILIIGVTLGGGLKFQDFFIRNLCQIVLWLFNVHIEVTGKENLKKGVLFLFNHSSHFDIPILVVGIPQTIRFGAKIELFKIPFFGGAMRKTGMLPIARNNRKKVLQVYRDASKNVSKGINYILAPEGTRKSGLEIGSFKSGPFLFGIHGQIPLLPVVIKGAYKVLSREQLLPSLGKWRNDVKLHILPSIQVEGYRDDDWSKLKDETHKIMDQQFQKM